MIDIIEGIERREESIERTRDNVAFTKRGEINYFSLYNIDRDIYNILVDGETWLTFFSF